jgi:hypothetical protein
MLSRILAQIWESIKIFLPVAYVQLQEAVLAQNNQVISFLMAEGSRRGFISADWWLISSGLDIRRSPLFLSVQLGHRSVFRKLVSIVPDVFQQLHRIPCRIEECYDCRKPFDYSRAGKVFAAIFLFRRKLEHSVNLAQTILALASVSAHRDIYFV